MSTLIHSAHPSGIMRDAVERIESLRSDHSKIQYIIGLIHFSIISISVIVFFLQSDPRFVSITEDMSLLTYQVIPLFAGIGLSLIKHDDGITVEECQASESDSDSESECERDSVRDEIERMKRKLREKEEELEKMRRRQFEDRIDRRLENLENMICHTSHDQNISETTAITVNDTSNSTSMEITWSVTSEGITETATAVSRGQCYEGRTITIQKNIHGNRHSHRRCR